MRRWLSLALGVLMAGVLVMTATQAFGGEEEGAVTAQGVCSKGTVFGITIAQETGLSFEVHLETGVPDQDWHVTLKYNKHILIDTQETTEEDGGFEIRKVERNAEGEDVGTLFANNLQTGEVCWGKLRGEF